MLDRGPKAARLNLRGSHGVAAAAFALGLGATVLGRHRVAAPEAAAYFAINLRFYELMFRRAGPRSAGSMGSVTVNTEPRPSRDYTVMRPPCAWAIH